ncbi:unnamed protein product, partial [Polarella glacialis]
VSSMFNCLQMKEPNDTPEDGVTCYAAENTQGSACSIACPAATVFRNYFVNDTGQGHGHQVNLLEDVAELVGNGKQGYWFMKNGFCLPRPPSKIGELSQRLAKDVNLADDVSAAVKVGVHWDTQALDPDEDVSQNVCQVLCSALPVALTKHTSAADWAPFATALLTGAYDATLSVAAVLAAQRGKRVKVFLTAVGAGSLGNRQSWILHAIDRVLTAHASEPLDVTVVHFSTIDKYKVLEAHRVPPSQRVRRTLTDKVLDLQEEVGTFPRKVRRPSKGPSVHTGKDDDYLMLTK